MNRRWSDEALDAFTRASKLPQIERESYLAVVCKDNPALLSEVRAILASSGGWFLPTDVSRGGHNESHGPHVSAAEVPERIGPYRLLRVLGEGGMGIVYEAEQSEPVSRRVALKIIKVGMDTEDVVRRFESERQALAVMDHPGIAKVFDAGATEKGRPYFVMELVDGVRLDEFCDQERLTTKERAELFITICEAVQHAHLKGVIHRDLKPSNVLVTEVNGRPLAKVIDFGVAKATGRRLTKETVVTTYGQAIGTLAYMSPEQAETTGLDIDTRSDVYSLGIVLFELLLGVVPVDPKEQGAWPFLAQLVQQDAPIPTPAHRLARLAEEEQEEIADRRRTDPSRLRTELGSDLQWVVLKALEKDRDRRYDTAEGLAADVRRCLAHQPVSAHPHSAGYRFRKFVRRNRAVVAMTAVLAVLSVFYAGTMSLQLRLVAQERDRATSEAETSQQISDFMTELFAVSDPSEARGRTVTAYEILQRGSERIETELVDQPAIQHKLLTVLGDVHTRLGLYDEAERLLMTGLDAARRGSVTPDSAVASSINQLAFLYRMSGRYEEAFPLYQRSNELAAEIWGTRSWQYGMTQLGLGVTQRGLGNFAEARTTLETALEVTRASVGPEHPDVGWVLYQLGWLAFVEGKVFEARGLYEEVIDLFEASMDPDDPNLVAPYNDMAVVLTELGELDEALAMHEKVLDVRERTLGLDHPSVASTHDNMAVVLNDLDEPERALEHQERALRIREEVFGPERPEVAGTLNNIGMTLQSLGRFREAVERYEEAIRIEELVGGPLAQGLRNPLTNLGYLLRIAGYPERARPLLLRALDIGDETLGPDHPELTAALVNLGYVELDAERFEQALQLFQRAIDIDEAAFGAEHTRIGGRLYNVGKAHLQAGEPGRAREVLERAMTILEKGDAWNRETLAQVCWELGKAFDVLGEPVTADSLFTRSFELAEADGLDGTTRAALQLRYWAYKGEVDQALDELEWLVESGYRGAWVFQEPDLAVLWNHPRFKQLTREISLARTLG